MAKLETKYKYEVHYTRIKNRMLEIKKEYEDARDLLIIFQSKIEKIQKELDNLDEIEIEITPVKIKNKVTFWSKLINLFYWYEKR